MKTVYLFLDYFQGKYVVKVITYAVQNYKPFVKVAVDHEVLQNGSSTMIFHAVVLKDLGVFGVRIIKTIIVICLLVG